MQFTADNQREFEKIVARYPAKRAALLPTLYLVQKQEGHLSHEAIRFIAEQLDLQPVQVYAVITFYTMFRTKPGAKFNLQVCTNLSCMLMGSEGLVEHLRKRLGIGFGEKTADGLFSITSVECLGSCGTAPVLQVNMDAYRENLDRDKLDRLLDELASGAASAARQR